MSLKAFHIVFIIASLALSAFFGFWSWREYSSPEGTPADLVYGVLSVLAFIGLLVYGKYVLKKLKHIGYL